MPRQKKVTVSPATIARMGKEIKSLKQEVQLLKAANEIQEKKGTEYEMQLKALSSEMTTREAERAKWQGMQTKTLWGLGLCVICACGCLDAAFVQTAHICLKFFKLVYELFGNSPTAVVVT
ncbi:uncharacterized protein Hap1MRO34_013657 [Clarias gariepinus]